MMKDSSPNAFILKLILMISAFEVITSIFNIIHLENIALSHPMRIHIIFLYKYIIDPLNMMLPTTLFFYSVCYLFQIHIRPQLVHLAKLYIFSLMVIIIFYAVGLWQGFLIPPPLQSYHMILLSLLNAFFFAMVLYRRE